MSGVDALTNNFAGMDISRDKGSDALVQWSKDLCKKFEETLLKERCTTFEEGLHKMITLGGNVFISNPLKYAWDDHVRYIRNRPKEIKILFVTANPFVRSLNQSIIKRLGETHPLGYDVLKWSGDELNSCHSKAGLVFRGFVEKHFREPETFFDCCYLINHCPLICTLFQNHDGNSLAVDFWDSEQNSQFSANKAAMWNYCTQYLGNLIHILKPTVIVSMGKNAEISVASVTESSITKLTISDPEGCTPEKWENDLSSKLSEEKAWKEVKMLESLKTLRRSLATELDGELKSGGLLKTEIEMGKHIARILNPLEYAWTLHAKYATIVPKDTVALFVGMNPNSGSPTGIPFFSSESGERFWRIIREEFDINSEAFFRHCFVINFCPLFFMGKNGNNVTNFGSKSDGLIGALMERCQEALKEVLDILKPELVIGISRFVEKKIKESGCCSSDKLLYMHHPAPRDEQNNRNRTYDDWKTNLKELLDKPAWKYMGRRIREKEASLKKEKR